MRTARVILLAAAIAAATACGASVRRQQGQRLAEADALFARGCYTCLRKAFDIYDALRLAAFQPVLTGARAFETAILLAAREKELAMEANGWIARAEALEAAARRPEGLRYLEIVRALPWAAGRHDRDQEERIRSEQAKAPRSMAEMLEAWETALGPPASRPIPAAYLMISARCAFTPAREQETLTVVLVSHPDAPLVRYAAGRCRSELRAQLNAVAGDADFHEAAFEHGRLRLYQGGATVHADARVLLEAAHAAMPEAIAPAYLLAGVLSSLGEYDACAEKYLAVARAGGARRESTLNRTVCLTHAAKRQDAIASATELIDTPGILRGEAFFWRAWNQYHAKHLPAARVDVEDAKALFQDADVYALSGFIAYDMDQTGYAYTEFAEALRRSRDYCVAAFYQGLIDAQQERWEAAAARYVIATGCYERSARRLEYDLRQAHALDADTPTRDTRIRNLTEGLDAEKLQLARAAYNVAYSLGRAGTPAKGIPYAEQSAAAHKDMQKLAAELLAILRKG